MNTQERKRRLALTFLFTMVVFFFLLLTILVVVGVVFLLIYLRVFTGSDSEPMDGGTILLIGAAGMLIVGFLFTLFFSKIPLKPVNLLINRMNRLAAGDYKARIRFGDLLSRHSSVQELTESFNTLAEELENTEVLRADFIDNFSHEFKTPIVSIAGFAKLMKRGNLTEEQRAEYLNIIEAESLRLSTMATNVLNLTKVENQTILTGTDRFNLSEQLRAAVLLFEEQWTQKNLELNLTFGEHLICANEELLMQVWVNLLDNAIKFTPEGGTVSLHVRETEKTLQVSVQNEGSAIPPEHLKRIFYKFYQVDKSHSAAGNGIGLALVRRITELHKGTVTAQSKDLTTVFTVELPKESA